MDCPTSVNFSQTDLNTASSFSDNKRKRTYAEVVSFLNHSYGKPMVAQTEQATFPETLPSSDHDDHTYSVASVAVIEKCTPSKRTYAEVILSSVHISSPGEYSNRRQIFMIVQVHV